MNPEELYEQPGRRSKLVAGAAWMGGARILNGLISFASIVLLARLLAPDDFGLFALATAISLLITMVAELSVSQALIHVEELEDGHFDTAFTIGLIRAAIMGGMIALAAHPIATFYEDQRLVEVLFVFAAIAVVGSLVSPRFVLLQRDLDFRGMVALDLADKIAGLIVAVGVAWATGSYFALPAGVLASMLARVVLSYVFGPYRPRLALSHWRDLVSFSIWMTLGTWVQTINWRTDPLVLGVVVPANALGQFSIAERLSGIISREILNPLSQMLFPAFSRIRSDAERLRKAYLAAQGVLILTILPLAIGLILLADPIVRLVLGEQWSPAVPFVQILGISIALRLSESLNPIAMATGNTKALFNRDLRSMLIRLPLMLLGIWWGMQGGVEEIIIGALIGRALAGAINSWLNMRLIAQISNVTPWDHAAIAARPVIAAAVMSAAVLASAMALPAAQELAEIAVNMLVLVAVGGVFYGAAILAVWLAAGRPQGAEVQLAEIARSQVTRLQNMIAR